MTMEFDSALAWLRAAYPRGVTDAEYPALTITLLRTVGHERTEQLLHQFCSGVGETTRNRAREAATHPEAVPEQAIYDVAARLARAGWPLAGPAVAEQQPGYLSRVLNWLRAGYPQGVPPQDYVPVLAVLQRQLSEDEVLDVVQRLIAEARAAGTVPSEVDARSAIAEITDEPATEEEVRRVRELLEQHGWPTDSPANSDGPHGPTRGGSTTAR